MPTAFLRQNAGSIQQELKLFGKLQKIHFGSSVERNNHDVDGFSEIAPLFPKQFAQTALEPISLYRPLVNFRRDRDADPALLARRPRTSYQQQIAGAKLLTAALNAQEILAVFDSTIGAEFFVSRRDKGAKRWQRQLLAPTPSKASLALAPFEGNRNRQALAALATAAFEHFPTVLRGHARTESVGSKSADVAWLVGSFHSAALSAIVVVRKSS